METKVCTRCGYIKLIQKFRIKNKKYSNICKACYNTQERLRRKRKREHDEETSTIRVCDQCGVHIPPGQGSSSYANRCKPCYRSLMNIHRANNVINTTHRKCSKCGILTHPSEFSVTAFHVCNTCHNLKSRNRTEFFKTYFKECEKCNVIKYRDEFSNNNDGTICKQCVNYKECNRCGVIDLKEHFPHNRRQCRRCFRVINRKIPRKRFNMNRPCSVCRVVKTPSDFFKGMHVCINCRYNRHYERRYINNQFRECEVCNVYKWPGHDYTYAYDICDECFSVLI